MCCDGKKWSKEKMSPVAKKNLFKQEKLCKCSDPIFHVSATLHGQFAIHTQSNMFLSNRQRERQPTQQAFDESRTASARLPADGLSFLLACFPCFRSRRPAPLN